MRTSYLFLSVAVVVFGLAFVPPAQATHAGSSGPVKTNLTATPLDLGTLGGKSSVATAVDGTIVVGWSGNGSGKRHAFAYDLAAAQPAMLD
jgi:probable HAF family extracellular repeat protein